ncbi:Ankyrin-1 like protein [Verticillium longisporum]|nr:Ankyrin-1 like protein [Verticillium longisporum]
MEGVPPGIQLSSQCSTVANRSAQLSIGLEKLAAQTNAGSLIHDELRELASIVSALSQGAEELSANLASATNLREQVRRQISSSMSSCELLLGGVSTDLEAALSTSAREQPELQPFTDAAELWRLHIEMVFAFQDIVHLEDVDQQQGVFAALETKLEDIERLMAEFHLSHPGPAPAAPEPSIPPEKQGVLPDYDTAHDNAQQEVPLYHDLSQRKGKSKVKSARAKGVFGGFNNIFKTLSSKINPIEPLVTPLCHAAAIGNIPQIKGLLGEGANINGHNEKGYTPLISAILANRLDAVNFLIDNYAKISTKDSTKNMPPLFHAAEAGYTDILKVLLSHGADPKASNTIGTPHFIGTVEKAPLASVALLLEHGADPNAVSAVGRHVLVAAVQRKDLPAVRLLLDHGAKISATNITGQPLLGVAVANKQLDMVKLLIDNGADVNARAGANGCPLSMAVNSGNIDLLRLLLASNANPDGKDVKSAPVLVNAISSGSLEMVTMLLEAGADADSRDITGRAVLLLAVQQDKLHIARLLLEHGAAATISNHSGTHLLTVVAKQPVSNEGEKLELMRLLLKAGANPNKHSLPWGYLSNMPLGHCIKHDKIELVRVLVEGGADPHITVASSPNSPKSPFEYALNHDKPGCGRGPASIRIKALNWA